MKTWGSGGIPPPFLTSALDGGDWSASRSGPFNHRETAPGTHSIGGWVAPRAGLEDVEKGNSLPPIGNRTRVFSRLAHSLVAMRVIGRPHTGMRQDM
jgi:hypothetical protein